MAPNGTGKSTIAQAICLTTDPEKMVDELLPFKLKESNPENKKPEIVGLNNIKNIMCFDEEYIRKFYFKEDELMNNSFDIFIRNDSYKALECEIEELVSETKRVFTDNKELELLMSSLKKLSESFKLTKSGISKASTGAKGLSDGNKVLHIPPGLEPYRPFIQSEKSVEWIDWQFKGSAFSDLSDNCPFCTSNTIEKKEQIKKVRQKYDKNIIKKPVENYKHYRAAWYVFFG